MGKPVFYRFRDLTRERLNVEYQVHTNRTDGEETIQAILEAARRTKLAGIAFTEHVRKSSDWFADFAGEVIKEKSNGSSPDIYVGCEAKALDAKGGLDAAPAVLAQCDIVLGSVHGFPPEMLAGRSMNDLQADECAEIELKLSLGLLRSAPIDVLAHPGGMTYRRFGSFPEKSHETLMKQSLARGIAIEINTSYLTDLENFLALCRKINPYVSIGSDVHRLHEVGTCRDRLLSFF
ncbi:PHP domain-containing protein [Paenibacillus sp. MBLB4367]|uniref:PHP domain-containing protein n=1 Tax=Paenibacillus sp. MBLB4367 TaxID=3384767 RepID=UPI003907F122